MNSPKGVICFDFDEFLGIFDPIIYDLDPIQAALNRREAYEGTGEEPPPIKPEERVIQIRHGIEKFLKNSIRPEFPKVITTGSKKDFAERGLKVAGLRKYFSEIFSFHDEGPRKDYSRVARQMQLENNNLLVLGHKLEDAPFDCPGAVFILDKKAIKHSASYLDQVLETILRQGQGNFLEGYKQIRALGKVHRWQDTAAQLQYTENNIPTIDILFSLRYPTKAIRF